ncbi:replication factor A1 [Halovenus aranensis]|uniref:Replication factor A1 n=1 Tax=Halovenus aranensis TaxID=890420 RepID=A0A1G8VI03_9EURY|nr:Single-stranded DNA binding protein [Halovenus aranensis]SDJ64780.1 replication factor A1 [Halovenus aranensis]
MSLDDHAEELASSLGVDKTEVKAKLENLEQYGVPMDEAKETVRRNYGDSESTGGAEIATKSVEEISTADSRVDTTVTVLSVGKRSIQYNGDQHVIFEGEFADESGKISYTSWEDFGLESGETVHLGNADVREWEGHPELNLGDSTSVERVEKELDIEYDVGGDEHLATLEPGDRGVNVEVRVLEVEQKRIDGRNGETEILSGVLGDETGRLPFTDWEPRTELSVDTSVRIEDVFIREFRGVPSVNVSEFSTVETLETPVEVADSGTQYQIGDAIETGGMFDIEVTGNVVAVRDGSGLIERCPECGRVIQSGQCRSHGEVEGEDDLRVKAILDDGTGTVTAILDESLTTAVYGGDLDDARAHAREEMDREVVADSIRDSIVGREYRVRGTLTVDDYGANLEATEFTKRNDDAETRATRLLAEVDP